MDSGTLVREKLDAAGRMGLHLQDARFPIETAFMVALSGVENARLYIVVNDLSQSEALYGEIIDSAQLTQDPNFNPFLVEVVGSVDPIAKAVLDFVAKHGSRFSTYASGRSLGQSGVDQVYIFASPLTAMHVP